MMQSCLRYATRNLSAFKGALSGIDGRLVQSQFVSCRSFSRNGTKSDEPKVERLFKNNRDWVDRVNAEDPTFFSEQAKGQHPDFLYIGCSDSRVSME